ncbi:hypothetical protein D3C78_1772650 [compost metagenome]
MLLAPADQPRFRLDPIAVDGTEAQLGNFDVLIHAQQHKFALQDRHRLQRFTLETAVHGQAYPVALIEVDPARTGEAFGQCLQATLER